MTLWTRQRFVVGLQGCLALHKRVNQCVACIEKLRVTVRRNQFKQSPIFTSMSTFGEAPVIISPISSLKIPCLFGICSNMSGARINRDPHYPVEHRHQHQVRVRDTIRSILICGGKTSVPGAFLGGFSEDQA